jgi:mono/diheme cytochrome c family protein
MRVARALLLAVGLPGFLVLTAMSTLADSSPSPNASGSAATGTAALPGDPTKGASLYAQNCTTCHGSGLEGGIGPTLNPIAKLPGVTNPLSPAYLIDTITNGIKPATGPEMPEWGTKLSPQDIKDLAAFIINENRSGHEAPLSANELAKRTILWVSIGIIAMIFITYLLSTYNMRWIARRAAARRK